jgi:hypothetical protein
MDDFHRLKDILQYRIALCMRVRTKGGLRTTLETIPSANPAGHTLPSAFPGAPPPASSPRRAVARVVKLPRHPALHLQHLGDVLTDETQPTSTPRVRRRTAAY